MMLIKRSQFKISNVLPFIAWVLLIVLTGYPALAATHEITLTTALQAAQEHNPTLVASRAAQDNAQRDVNKAATAYGINISVDGRPLAGVGVQLDKTVPTKYNKGDARLNTSLTTLWGISGTMMCTHTYKLDGSNNANTSLAISINAPLDPGSILYSSTRLTLANQAHALSKAVWDYQQLKRQVAISTLRTYWQLELDAVRLEFNRTELAAKTAEYQQIVAKAANGGATDADVLSVLIELRQAEAILRRSESNYFAQLEQFAMDLGLPAEQSLVLAPSGFVTEAQLTQTFDQDALETAAVTASPAVMKKQLDLTAAQERMRATRLGLLPAASLSTNYSIPNLGQNLNTANNSWSIHLNVNYPIIDTGGRKYTMESQQAAVEAVQAALAQAEDAARRTLQQKLTEWNLLKADTEIARLKLEQARLQEVVKAEHFRLGTITAEALATAQRACQQAELNLQAAWNTQFLAELEIALIVGDPLMLGGLNLQQ